MPTLHPSPTSGPRDLPAWQAAVLAEARTWLGTPFCHEGDVRGVGVDCFLLTIRVYEATGCIPPIPDPRPYPRLWAVRDNRYLDALAPYVVPREGRPQPADVALFRMGRAPCHAAIVMAWPRVLHADPEVGVVETDAILGGTPGPFVCAVTPRVFLEEVAA